MLQHDSIPWRRILTSAPVNALSVCNFSRNFVFFFLLTNEPLFLNVFGYNIAEVIRVMACDKTSACMRQNFCWHATKHLLACDKASAFM